MSRSGGPFPARYDAVMDDVAGIIAAVLLFAAWLGLAKALTAAMRRESAGRRLEFWQFTLTQFLVLGIALAVLCWLCRMVCLDRFGPA